ncbi:MAG: DUF2953 domain-containing protein [Oscillospiraceae bacterium]|nr:DUF2953 domain-containing protein [Oscillospiraceae bacterium]
MGWTIAGIIFIIILLLTLGKVSVMVDYGELLIVKIKYMFFPIFTLPQKKEAAEKPKKAKRKKKEQKKKDEKPDDKENKEKKKPALGDIIELVKAGVDSLGKPLKKILKRVEISHLKLNIVCGGEDAAKAAITFGAVNMAVGNLLGWIDTFFTLKPVDELSVNVDFESEQTTAKAYVMVKLTVAAALAFVFTLIGRALGHYFTHKETREAVKNMVSTDKAADNPS